ncbi:MAG TPA: DegT/DnrJ/EryC1/StrS family aminotransferase [Bacteroidales bacterium]|nr:DegT/DnrJ/EryC1/StrS family aminotransferase [Bacteroidales bacterium]HQI70386.1 DegT/DnrJ/EryC1/StrS family aminotransferase [Bacteroidales bacterium]
MEQKKIYVTQPFLPPLEEYNEYLKKIWESGQLTNNGQFHQQLEQELCKYLGVKYISLFANGTLALITALQAIDIKGEVITTPYSFVATAHSLVWNGITPVFVDVDPVYGNLDPKQIEAAITPKTSAILPVHVYGHPCRHLEIKKTAEKFGLKLVYDAAHAFGVKENNSSVLNFGDLSILSFHATKVYTTLEGGAIVCHSPEMKKHIDNLKNFGFRDYHVVSLGINAKMNEVQAAMGLLQLKYIDAALQKRKQVSDFYFEHLQNTAGLRLLSPTAGVTYNYSYFPVFIDKKKFGKSRDELFEALEKNNIFGRRYFHPLITQFPSYRNFATAQPGLMPVAEKIADQVICLPIYPDLDEDTLRFICKIINKKI